MFLEIKIKKPNLYFRQIPSAVFGFLFFANTFKKNNSIRLSVVVDVVVLMNWVNSIPSRWPFNKIH
jgi:hypothetical protein